MNKERPILFNGDMARAVLLGEKTQTRRAVTTKTLHLFDAACRAGECGSLDERNDNDQPYFRQFSPFGQPSDRLWVRESFRVHGIATDVATLVYKASVRHSYTEQTRRVPVCVCNKPVSPEKWTPSIHMPRWASRTLLEITNVRVERLNDITEADCWAEGILEIDGQFSNQEIVDMAARLHLSIEDARAQYALLWESIYGAGSWDKNPWVWVIEFKRME